MSDDVLIPIVAILMPLILVVAILAMRQSSRRREMLHEERMKALEMGRPVPGSEAWASRVAIATGAIMPMGVFTIAWLASLTTGLDEDIWIAAGLVGGAGVLGSIVLMSRAKAGPPRDEIQPRRGASLQEKAAKPAFDPDAYEDIVRHG